MLIIEYLNKLSNLSKYLIFQMGFNWGGNINKPLFKKGTKEEMIDFVKKGTKSYWQIFSIGVPNLINGKIKYLNIDQNNIARIDSLGEFLNRPLFFLKSRIKT